MTQDSGVHLYNEGDTIHFVSDKQSMGAGGIWFKESSKGTLVSAYFPTLESLVRNYYDNSYDVPGGSSRCHFNGSVLTSQLSLNISTQPQLASSSPRSP